MMFQEEITKLKEKVSKLNIQASDIIVWGMGHISMLYDNAFKIAKVNVSAYTCNEKTTWGELHNELPVIAPSEITSYQNPTVIIAVKNKTALHEIEEQLGTMDAKIKKITIEEFFFGYYADIIFGNVDILEDEKSKEIYKSVIEKRIKNDDKMWEEFEENQYFALPMFRRDDVNEVFVDMGGFVGDTLERYLFTKFGTFRKAYVFEPDKKNYEALLIRIDRLKKEWNVPNDAIVPVFAGVGRENSVYYFKELEVGSYGSHFSIEKTEDERKIYSVDEFFLNEKVDFLKADIESYELDMLIGAERVLRRDKPKLAISIYHNAVDMCCILKWLSGLNLGYKFYVRHHSVRDTETVLYAYCE